MPEEFLEIFIVDNYFKPIGSVPSSKVLRTPRDTKMQSIMNESQLSIPVDMDREEVANIFENYNLNSACVVDKNNKLVGMITSDDVLTVLKEFMIGILNGIIFAIISAMVVQVWFNDTTLSLIISISMVLNMIVAGLFGILVPISLKKFNIDPAIASSVFVTTITDVIGFVSFLGVGAYFL